MKIDNYCQVIFAISSGEGFNPAKVRFVTDKEKEYKAAYDEAKKGWTVTIVGSEAGDGQHLYVVQEQGSKKYATLARLNIYTYSPKTVKVKLVPVNGFTNNFTANEVSTQLNTIYNKVGVTCEVEMANSFNYTFTNGTFNVTGSGLFSTLTGDMKALNGAYMQANPNEDAICLFIIKDVTGNENVVGDMPRGKQFGYLFSGATAQTIAHEIGHGVFHLDHPFDRANAAKSFAKGDLVDNLMEYGSGTNLVKLQWDAIHAPGLVIGLFEKDDDAMRKNEAERSQITRFMYAFRNVIQDQTQFSKSKVLQKNDIDKLNSKEYFSVRADHIFYDESLKNYFEEVEMKLYFDAKNRQANSPNELFFIRDIDKTTYESWYIGSLDAVIVFVFKQRSDIPTFIKFWARKLSWRHLILPQEKPFLYMEQFLTVSVG